MTPVSKATLIELVRGPINFSEVIPSLDFKDSQYNNSLLKAKTLPKSKNVPEG